MRSSPLLALFVVGASAVSAMAADLSLTITNMAAEPVTSLIATPLGASGPSAQNLLAAPVDAEQDSAVVIAAGEGECVFNLAITFASGKTLDRPDTDLCQTDGIVIE